MKEQTFSKAFSQSINNQSTYFIATTILSTHIVSTCLLWSKCFSSRVIWNYVLFRHESITSTVIATARALYYMNVINTMYRLAKCWLLTRQTSMNTCTQRCQFSFRTTHSLKSNFLQLYTKEVKTTTKATNHNGVPLDTLPNGVPWNLKPEGSLDMFAYIIHDIFIGYCALSFSDILSLSHCSILYWCLI